jgi:hypothetical protein
MSLKLATANKVTLSTARTVRALCDAQKFSYAHLIQSPQGGYEMRLLVSQEGANQIFQIGLHKETKPRLWKSADSALGFIKEQFGSFPVVVFP